MKTNASYESAVTVRYKMDRPYDSPRSCVFMEICEVPVRQPDRLVRRFPASWPGTLGWWRRGDSTFRGFRCGLDYAFIRTCSDEHSDAERVIRPIESARS
jgi:hypothetical protein